MDESDKISRRSAMGIMAGTAAALVAGSSPRAENPSIGNRSPQPGDNPSVGIRPQAPDPVGAIKHSVCRWCYSKIPLDELCKNVAAMGIQSVELLDEKDWEVAKNHGLTCAMPNGPSGIVNGWNMPADHDKLVKRSEELLPKIKAAGFSNMILLSGNLRGLSYDESLQNCANGIKRITKLAESLQITLCLELLNSKRDHKDYAGDRMPWGVELCKRVGSERFKILYDIYHMQIMEGDVIATIQENIQYIGHFHTGGNPGRHEIDDTQELNYRRITQAIVDTGFKGFMAQEFIPARDPMTSLKQAIEICTV